MKTKFIISNYQEGAEPFLKQSGFVLNENHKTFEKELEKEILLNSGDKVMILLECLEVVFKCYDLDNDVMTYSLMNI